MRINWKLKSLIYFYIDKFKAYNFLYFLQKYITGRSKVIIDEINPDWLIHQDNLRNLDQKHIIEFGAGKSLSQNIFLSNTFEKQTLVDKFDMIDFDQFNSANYQIKKLENNIQYKPVFNLKELNLNHNITYIAPFDFSNNNLKEDIFDGCISTNTLEHISKNDIKIIFKELKRIIKKDGLISAVIDYSDHYAHTDKNIGLLNYLKFSSKEFKKYNHSSHFQNRLRHSEYENIFTELDYELLVNEAFNEQTPPKKISDEIIVDKLTFMTKGIFLLKNRK